jgi:8-hydroxy-5-deazaflavin:NADPH oxidoreductase
VRVAILGGTGPFGRALAIRLREAGEDDVVVGSREQQKAEAVAAELGVLGAQNDDAIAGADLVIVACNADAAVATCRATRTALVDVPLLSVASELHVEKGVATPPDTRLSLAEQIAEVVDAPVVAGLHSLAAGKLARGRPDEDALVCGDDADAKAIVLEIAARVVAGRAIDVGPLVLARPLEGLTAAIINVNKRYAAHAGIRITGIE